MKTQTRHSTDNSWKIRTQQDGDTKINQLIKTNSWPKMKNKERKKENETSLRSPLRAPIWSRVHPRSSLSTPPPDLMERRLDKLRRNKDVSSCRCGSSSSIFTIPNHTHTRTIIEKRKTTTIIQLNLFGLQRSKRGPKFCLHDLEKNTANNWKDR